MTVTITADELAQQLGSSTPPVLLDVRWALGGPHGHSDYTAGHLPGAVFADLDADLSGEPSAEAGRHPLPDVAALQQSMRSWGINEGDAVVVYDGGTQAAARAWWVLRWAGVQDVRILDGGLSAWTGNAGTVEKGEVTADEGDVWARPGWLPSLSVGDAADFDGVLIDARAGERYRGEHEPIDPRAGHIPGAVNLPIADTVGEDGRFLPAADLRARFERLGVTEGTAIGAYCGSGVSAAHEIAALEIAGFTAALYPGSWSQWSNTDRTAATGD